MNTSNGNSGSAEEQQQQQQQQQQQLAMLLGLAQQRGGGGSSAAFNPASFGPGAGIEEQILQRATALRSEALQQQMFGGANMEQEAILARLGLGGFGNAAGQQSDLQRLQQQLQMGRLEEMERARRQMAFAMGGGNLDVTQQQQQQPPPPAPDGAAAASAEESESTPKPAAANNEPPKFITTPNATSATGEVAGEDAEEESEDAIAERKREELKKAPGTVIVPCRARGMPMEHNFKTAYFVISEDAQHGEDLVCSYFQCRNGGVKFRYCSHCMAPVAKRNFTRRHDHGQNLGALADSDLDDDMDESERTSDKLEDAKSSARETSAKRKRDTSDLSDVDESDYGGPRNGNGANVSAKRRSMWGNLLSRRPRTKDPRNLSSWLNEVLTVSDLDFPVEQASTTEKSKAKKPRKPKKPSAGKPAKSGKKATAPPQAPAEKPTEAKTEPDVTDKAATNDGASKASTGNADADEATDSIPARAEKEPQETKVDTPSTEEEESKTKKEQDGFSGSFADWRDRKKGKKGISSLKK